MSNLSDVYNMEPEQRSGDEHMKRIVHLTVREIFDGLGVDLSTSQGRQRFRDNIAFVDDARTGTAMAKKTIWGLILTGFAFGAWKVLIFLAPVLGR